MYAKGNNSFLEGFQMGYHIPETPLTEVDGGSQMFQFATESQSPPNNRVTPLPLYFDGTEWTVSKINQTQFGVKIYTDDNPSPF